MLKVQNKEEETIHYAKKLHLINVKNNLATYIERAKRENLSHLDFLNYLLREEVEQKEQRAKLRRVKEACFPYPKSLEDFEIERTRNLTQDKWEKLISLEWIDQIFNLILIGPPGIGKTHLSIALGTLAAKQGYAVSFVTMKELVQLLKTENINFKNKNRLKRIRSSRLLIIDEVGYLPISPVESGLFFHLLSELHLKTSILITSNKSFDQWPEFFGDEDVVLGALDRILFHCDVLSLDGDSYRLEHRESLL